MEETSVANYRRAWKEKAHSSTFHKENMEDNDDDDDS